MINWHHCSRETVKVFSLGIKKRTNWLQIDDIIQKLAFYAANSGINFQKLFLPFSLFEYFHSLQGTGVKPARLPSWRRFRKVRLNTSVTIMMPSLVLIPRNPVRVATILPTVRDHLPFQLGLVHHAGFQQPVSGPRWDLGRPGS